MLQEGEPGRVALKIVEAKEHIQREVEAVLLLGTHKTSPFLRSGAGPSQWGREAGHRVRH